ncbi:MAG: response regulator [Sphingomicrobium sp.]
MTRTILLIEDEPLLREVTSEDLRDLGFETACARDGDEGIEFLQRGEPFAALITDIRMPGAADGWQVAERAREIWPELPVIYLSGYSNEGASPVDGAVFVKKPYRISDIEGALAALALI